MCNAPYSYDYINAIISQNSPNTVHVQNTALFRYFQRYLLQKAISVFSFKLPDWWDSSYFMYTLFCYGFTAVINTDKYGIIPQGAALSGYNIFYNPAYAIISNPLFSETYTLKIGKDCAIIKLLPDYRGVMDKVNYYAELLALCIETASIDLYNTRLAYVFGAKNKNMAESFKKMYDKISSGEPAVFINKELFDSVNGEQWKMFEQNLSNNYIVSDILLDMAKIERMFETDFGIPNTNTDKRERLTDDEVNANNIGTQALASLCLREMRRGMDSANKMFGINLAVDWAVNVRGLYYGEN